ncbi:MAG: hypothetical protein N2C14_22695, partial [Planctomycetales bacterium]
GYAANAPLEKDHPFLAKAIPVLVEALPSADAALNREIARLLGMLGGGREHLLEKITAFFTETSAVEDDVHYLIVLSRLPGDRNAKVTRRAASALARLSHKMRRGRMQPSRFWPARVGETFDELTRRDESLTGALVADGPFGLPDHSMFATRMNGADRLQAARRIIDGLGDVEDWTPDLVRLTTILPAEQRRSQLRELWAVPALRETIAVVLAGEPSEDNRSMLVEILRFGQPSTVGRTADALIRLDAATGPDEIAAAVSSLRQFSREPRYAAVCRSLDRLLARWTGLAVAERIDASSCDRWITWLRETHPKLASQLDASTIDLATWRKRLKKIDWESGNAARGALAFQRRACARCHGNNARLGPDLKAVARRFSREDLFTAILDPNRDVSPAYRLTQLETSSGQIISGQVLYDSPESTLVQTGPDTTVRITGVEIVSRRKSPLSPMPAGLLREASDQEAADLYAWFRKMGANDPKPAREGKQK